MATPNGTQFQVATDSGFATKLVDYNYLYKTTHDVATNTLTRGVQLYARVRHSSAETGYSAWSPTRQFMVAKYNRYFKYNATGLINGARAMGVDGSGNIYVIGTIYSLSRYMALVIKYDYRGAVLWCNAYALPTYDYLVYHGVVDTAGNVFLAGAAHFGTGSRQAAAFLTKITNNGTIVWQKLLKDPVGVRYSAFSGLVIYGNYIYAVGTYWYSDTMQRGLIAKYWNTDGTFIWQRYLSTEVTNYGTVINTVTIDTSGTVYVGGNQIMASTLVDNSFVAGFTSDGVFGWIRILSSGYSGLPHSTINGICIDTLGNYLYAIGYCWNNADSARKSFVVKIIRWSADLVWKKDITTQYGANYTQFNGIAYHPTENKIALVGYDKVTNTFIVGNVIIINTDATVLSIRVLSDSNNSYTNGFKGVSILSTGEWCLFGITTGAYPGENGIIMTLIPPAGDAGVYGPILNLTSLKWLDYAPSMPDALMTFTGNGLTQYAAASGLGGYDGTAFVSGVPLTKDVLAYY